MIFHRRKPRPPEFRVADADAARIAQIAAELYSLESMAADIRAHLGLGESEVWRRLALEMESPGYNVNLRCREYGVTPHVFSDAMIRMYSESDGFVFETLVESRNPHRAGKWLRMVQFMLSVRERVPGGRHVLLYGDSVGSDSIFLSKLGFQVAYHDYDSVCSRFARYRFDRHGVTVTTFDPAAKQPFGFVICLEVAEHVPDPEKLVVDLAGLTATDGYCLFSEAYNLVQPAFPTHLSANQRFAGQSDRMFLGCGMRVAWRDRDDKPIVYHHA